MSGTDLLEVLHASAAAVRRSLDGLDDWGLAGTRPGQYRSDLAADDAAVPVLLDAGLGVLSEESGLHGHEREVLAVLDPVDGSTNASRAIPWFATSVCALDEHGPLAAVVVNQATGTSFEAVRGEGARCDGRALHPSGVASLADAVLGTSGYPPRHLGWRQFRVLGAAALDLCAVAAGILDAYVDYGADSHAPWDYLGGLLVCTEAGAGVVEAHGRDLVVRGYRDRRSPLAAATPALLEELQVALSVRESDVSTKRS